MSDGYILDLGWGNLGAMRAFFLKLGLNLQILTPLEQSSDLEDQLKNSICVIPGIGSGARFAEIPLNLRQGLHRGIRSASLVIGICLGAHFLSTKTSEGNTQGLGLFDIDVDRFSDDWFNIGYCDVTIGEKRFSIYHCHSYIMPVNEHTISEEVYSGVSFSTVLRDGNFWLLQGHPEKSGVAGELLVKEILSLCSID